MFKINTKNNGFTLIETILVVGLISLFLLSAYFIFNKVTQSYEASAEARDMNGIVGSVNSLIGMRSGDINLTAKLLADARIIDHSRVSSDGQQYTSFTGQQVSFSTVFNRGISHIQITYHNTPLHYCTKLGYSFSPFVDLMTVNGAVVQNAMPDQPQVPYDVATLATACSTDETATMVFNFRR